MLTAAANANAGAAANGNAYPVATAPAQGGNYYPNNAQKTHWSVQSIPTNGQGEGLGKCRRQC